MSVYYLQNASVVPPGPSRQRAFHLSPRQIDVLRLLGDGLSNKQIGRALGISYQTVKQHIQCVLEELGAANRLQAVVFAYRRGILAFDEPGISPATLAAGTGFSPRREMRDQA